MARPQLRAELCESLRHEELRQDLGDKWKLYAGAGQGLTLRGRLVIYQGTPDVEKPWREFAAAWAA